MTSYNRNDVAPFCRVTDEYGFLSNFHPSPVIAGGRSWKTSEHLYQAAKFSDKGVIDKIWRAESPSQAKAVAYQNAHLFELGWDDVKVIVMAEVIAAKIANWYGVVLDLFQRAGDKPFVEVSTKDQFWGAKPSGDTFVGHNALGKVWTGYKICWERGHSLGGPRPSGWLPSTSNIDKFLVAI